MVARFRSWWKKIKSPLLVVGIIAVSVLVIVTVVGIIGGYLFHWDWTGITAKTLWDWLNLLAVLAIPVAVGFGAAWYTERHSHDLQIMAENQRETALQAFIDKVPDLKLLKDNLAGTKAQIILNARTSALFPSLDANRKGTALKFLYELKLVYRREFDEKLQYPIIKLKFADLSGANLTGLILTMADLSDTNLRNADLRNADLVGADLSGADLSGANLSGAKVTTEQLYEVKSLKGATMPDGSIHPFSEKQIHLYD
jgi:pentapeptide repeat protein